MFRWYCVHLAAWGLLLPLEAGAVREAVKDVRFSTYRDKVHIYYTLEGSGEYEVTLRLSDDGGRTFPTVLRVEDVHKLGLPKSLSGAVGKGVKPGRDKEVIWDVLRDRHRLEGSDYVFQVATYRSASAGGTKANAYGAALGICLGGILGSQLAGQLPPVFPPSRQKTWGKYGVLIGIGGTLGWIGSSAIWPAGLGSRRSGVDLEMRAKSPRGSIYLSRRQPPTEQTPPGLPARLVVEELRRAEMLADGGGIDVEEIPLEEAVKDRPGLPAHLVLEERAFREPGGNGALDAGETGSLHLRIANDGLGPARVSIRLTPLGPVEDLAFVRYWTVGELPVGQSRRVEIPLKADLDLADGQREVRVEVVDETNRGFLPFTLRFPTRALDPPEFRIVLRDYDDGGFFRGNRSDGRVSSGEMIKVTANIQNVGGTAERVVATVQAGGREEGAVYYRDLEGNSDSRFVLERLETGEHRDVEFYFYTEPVFDRATVDFELTVKEAQGSFGTEEVLSFNVGRSVETETFLAVEAVREQRREAGPLVTVAGIDIEEIPLGSQTRREQGLAVIIGIERYKHAPPATWKLRDATTFYQYSRDVLGIPEDRIMLRTDEDATKGEFDSIFDPQEGWLKKRLRDGEAAAETDLFVYLAGHGYPDLATGKPYLIPHDVRPEQATIGVSLHDLYQTLNDLRTRSVTVFVESCFSGMTGYHSGPPQLLAMNTNPVAPVMERPLVGPAMVVYTATSGEKPSSNRDDLKHGIFTYFVLKGLGGQADGDGDRAVTVEELYDYLAKEVPAKALEPPLDREQVPEIRPPVGRLGDRGRRILVQY